MNCKTIENLRAELEQALQDREEIEHIDKGTSKGNELKFFDIFASRMIQGFLMLDERLRAMQDSQEALFCLSNKVSLESIDLSEMENEWKDNLKKFSNLMSQIKSAGRSQKQPNEED